MNKFFFLCIIVLFIAASCDKKEEPIIIFEIPTNALLVDHSNTLWIGNVKGLYKSVENETDAVSTSIVDTVLSLSYDSLNEILWVGTQNGLLKYDIVNNTDEVISETLLSDPTILSSMVEEDGKSWFGTSRGFTLNYENTWKNDSFRVNVLNTMYPMKTETLPINSIASWDGDFYLATSGGSLYRATGFNSDYDAFSGATQWSSPYNGDNISANMFVVFVDNEGKQWMGGESGMQVHTGHNPLDAASFTYYNDELSGTMVYAINQAPNGNIWVGTNNGLSIFNGTSWSIIKENLPDPKITTIAFDNDGNAWVGTPKGIFKTTY